MTETEMPPFGSMPTYSELRLKVQEATNDVHDRLVARVAELEERLFEKELKSSGASGMAGVAHLIAINIMNRNRQAGPPPPFPPGP